MWISVPTKVTSSTKVSESGSMRSPADTSNEPAGTQLNKCCWTRRSAAGRPSSAMVIIAPIMNEAAEATTPSTWPHLSALRPATSRIPALSSGIAISSQASEKVPSAAAYSGAAAKRVVAVTSSLSSVLQQVDIVDRGRTASTEDRDNNRQAHHDFCSGHDHDEERHDLAIEVAVHACKSHESQVGRVEHQLDAHENDDGVAAHQNGCRANREYNSRKYEVASQSHLLALRCLIGARLGSGGFRYFCRPGYLHLFPGDGLVHLDGGRSEVINTALLAPNAQDPRYGVFDRASGVVERGGVDRIGSRIHARRRQRSKWNFARRGGQYAPVGAFLLALGCADALSVGNHEGTNGGDDQQYAREFEGEYPVAEYQAS